MAYTARQLITRSWYLSGIVARRAQTVDGDQIHDGLSLLNSLLDWKSADTTLIPYWTYDESIVTVPQQETYFIPNCLDIETVTFNYSQVRYQMEFITRNPYFGSGRVNNVFTLPFNWTFVRGHGGGTLYLYFIPDNNYPLNIMAKFGLTDVTLDQDISIVYDGFYLEYLRYALAQYMCSEYGILFNPESDKILAKLTRTLMYVDAPDLSVRKVGILSQGSGLNWGDVNLGRGFRPS
jgi:hypothetical protein